MSFGQEILVPITLVIAAPSALTSEVLSHAFDQRRRQFKVLGYTHTRKSLLKHVAEFRPDVVLIDTQLERDPSTGLRALRELHLNRSSTRAILLVDCSDPKQVVPAFVHGAKGVICKTEPFQVLCKCIRSVHAGQVWANSSELQWVLGAFSAKEKGHLVSSKGARLLSNRENQIVRLAVEGISNREISEALRLSPHTVKNHLYRIYNKIGVSNRGELTLYVTASRAAGQGDDASNDISDS